ncbi:MAG: cbb3-type cytochrome c oxidase subunit I [Acidobacteriia bacterium]|nr:cbb3-type cytochrome c oxidase subunit I [Terriglobia bacterium]
MHDMSVHAAHHAPPTSFIRKHVFSLDHKVIGKQYYGLALLAAFIGMFLSWLMRIHLAWNNAAIPGLQILSSNGAPGGVMTPEYYLQLMTMHGTIMVFFVLTTAPFAAFGNYFLPIQVGAEDMPFPHFNMMSFWVTFSAFLVLMASFFVGDGPTLGGWTQYGYACAPMKCSSSCGLCFRYTRYGTTTTLSADSSLKNWPLRFSSTPTTW